jgi:hypothetical protein
MVGRLVSNELEMTREENNQGVIWNTLPTFACEAEENLENPL